MARVISLRGRLAARGKQAEGVEVPWAPLLLAAYALLVAAYFVSRAGGMWAEGDTAFQSSAIRSALNAGSIGQDYPNGYAYTALSVFLVSFTGLDLGRLQQLLYPLLSALLVVPAWMLFRELTGSRRAATLATVLLFSQPEFMFVVMRGSHERLLRLLMMVMLWLLVRSFQLRDKPRQFAIHVVLFYACAYGLVATNTFFATSFVIACAMAMVAASVLSSLRPRTRALTAATARRLAYVGPAVMVLGFVFMFYIYPPAGKTLVFVHDVAQETAKVTLTTSSQPASNPYDLVVGAWISTPVYVVLSIGDYLLMAAAAAVLLWQGWRWLRDPSTFSTNGRWLLWLFCGTFALQGILAVAADRTGQLGGNLEYRSFPSFAMLAAPLVATVLTDWRLPRAGSWAIGVLIALLAGLGLLKATNEPSLSNVWMAYSSDEMAAMQWTDQHLTSSSVWSGYDDRLRDAYATAVGDPLGHHNDWPTGDPRGTSARTFLMSDIIRLQSSRFVRPLPPVIAQNRVYDSGSTQVYHEVQQTPYRP